MSPDPLVISIAPAAEEVARLLDAIEAWCEAAELPPGPAHRVAVVIEELAANVAMHGSDGPDGATQVSLALRRDGDLLVAVLEDDGAAFDPLSVTAPDTAAALEDREVGGLGIHFARKMARRLDYHRAAGRNRVTAVFDAA